MREFRFAFIVSVAVLHCMEIFFDCSVVACEQALTRSALAKAKPRETSRLGALHLKSRWTFQNFLVSKYMLLKSTNVEGVLSWEEVNFRWKKNAKYCTVLIRYV